MYIYASLDVHIKTLQKYVHASINRSIDRFPHGVWWAGAVDLTLAKVFFFEMKWRNGTRTTIDQWWGPIFFKKTQLGGI
jgi:hypothetical protein